MSNKQKITVKDIVAETLRMRNGVLFKTREDLEWALSELDKDGKIRWHSSMRPSGFNPFVDARVSTEWGISSEDMSKLGIILYLSDNEVLLWDVGHQRCIDKYEARHGKIKVLSRNGAQNEIMFNY